MADGTIDHGALAAPTRTVRQPRRPPAAASSADTFDRAIVAFAEAYADQNERDHAALAQAVTSGRVRAGVGI
jgi:hypothetical protein